MILQNCKLDDSAVFEIITYIMHFRIKIDTLDLSCNELTSKCCEFLANLIGTENYPVKNIFLNENT